MSRADAIKKLLFLGDLSRCDVIEIMGGDRASVDSALADLVNAGDVNAVSDWSQGARFCRLSESAKATAFGGVHA